MRDTIQIEAISGKPPERTLRAHLLQGWSIFKFPLTIMYHYYYSTSVSVVGKDGDCATRAGGCRFLVVHPIRHLGVHVINSHCVNMLMGL